MTTPREDGTQPLQHADAREQESKAAADIDLMPRSFALQRWRTGQQSAGIEVAGTRSIS